mgnify:FL=1
MQLSIQEISNSGIVGFDYYKTCYHETIEISRKLKAFILDYQFSDEKEEIEFFKDIKPRFQSRLMYFKELIQVEVQKPLVSEKRLLAKYYRRSSNHYSVLASRNQIFLHYMRSNFDSGDHLLFVRSSDSFDFIQTDLDLDENYSTPASAELAKLISYELVIDHLGKKIERLSSNSNTDPSTLPRQLVWTGRKAALIELAYGLQSAGIINNGNASVAQIIEALEYIFNVSTGKYYRVFQNIRIRQGSRTLFMDEVINALNKRMDETDMK